MTLNDLHKELEKTGLPVAYNHFSEGETVDIPCIAYRVESSENFNADDSVYEKSLNIVVELYTNKKDLITEEKVENALSLFNWDMYEDFIEAEKLYMLSYTFQL